MSFYLRSDPLSRALRLLYQYRGESNVGDYAFIGNWGYTVQRWTGAIAFFYIIWHTATMRWMGTHLVGNAAASFGKVQMELQHPWALAFYVIGILCASVHLSYGLWLFAAKWGITSGPQGTAPVRLCLHCRLPVLLDHWLCLFVLVS